MKNLEKAYIGKKISGSFLTFPDDEVIELNSSFLMRLFSEDYVDVEIFHVRLLENYHAVIVNHLFLVPIRTLIQIKE